MRKGINLLDHHYGRCETRWKRCKRVSSMINDIAHLLWSFLCSKSNCKYTPYRDPELTQVMVQSEIWSFEGLAFIMRGRPLYASIICGFTLYLHKTCQQVLGKAVSSIRLKINQLSELDGRRSSWLDCSLVPVNTQRHLNANWE